MSKLVAFYSRADENYFGGAYRYIKVGNTEKVAKIIVEKTGADLFKIEQVTPYSANYQECIAEAKKDLQTKARPKLTALPVSLDGYDEIYLGFPNYWGSMPMAVYGQNFSNLCVKSGHNFISSHSTSIPCRYLLRLLQSFSRCSGSAKNDNCPYSKHQKNGSSRVNGIVCVRWYSGSEVC